MEKMPRLVRVGEMPPLGHLDGVDLADEVGNGDVGGGQLFRIAVFAADPFDAGVVAGFGSPVAAALADGIEGVAVNLAAGNLGDGLVQQVDQAADDAGLGLTPFAQQDQVLAGQDGVFQLGDDGVLKTDDAGEHDLLGPHLGHQVSAHLLAHRSYPIAAVPQLADSFGPVGAQL